MSHTRRHFRRVEAPSGTGALFDGERQFATVRYGLTVLQEIVGTQHWTGATAAQGNRQIAGRLSVMSGSLPFDGDRLTLRLDDGRRLAFVAIGSGPDYTMDADGSLR